MIRICYYGYYVNEALCDPLLEVMNYVILVNSIKAYAQNG